MACGQVLAQTSRTWNGSVSTDWYNASNWTPAGVPAANDTVNFNGGNINLSAPVTINGQFNWSGGTLSGNPLTIASIGTLNLLGAGSVALSTVLTNAGTINWSNSVTFYVYNNNSAGNKGAIWNLAGGLFNIQSDQGLSGQYCCAFFNNAGTITKGANSGTTSFNLVFTNSGSVTATAGNLNFNGGGDIDGTFTAGPGAGINFNGGTFVYSLPPTLTALGTIQLSGGSLTLVSNTIPNLQLTGGSVSLGPNFQGGVITNLTLAGANLNGSYAVTGVLNCSGGVSGGLQVASAGVVNWTGGTISGPLGLVGGSTLNWSGGTATGPVNIAKNGVLNLLGGGSVALWAPLTNAGIINWSNSVTFYVYNNNSAGNQGAIWNLAGGLFNIQSDQGLSGQYCCAFMNNAGTISKGANTGTTTFSLNFTNTGAVMALKGTINFNGGGDIDGMFTASAGADLNFNGGNFVFTNAPTVNGPGAVQLTGGNLTLLNSLVPNLSLVGGSVNVGAGFQGGTITNLTSGATLNGNFTVSGVFNCSGGVSGSLFVTNGGILNFSGGTISGSLTLTNGATANWPGGNVAGNLQVASGALLNWSGGTANGPVNIATNGVANLLGGGSVALWAPLTNAGTINWSNSVTFYVYNNNSSGNQGAIWNLPGALFNIQSDQGVNGEYCCAVFNNSGTISKGANSGTSTFNLGFNNSGLVTVLKGSMTFNGGGDLDGTFTAVAGTVINFNGGNFTFQSPPVLNGPGAIQLTGGSLALSNTVPPNLVLLGGAISVGTNFQGGAITNLTSSATLTGNFTVSGVFNCGGGVSGSVLVNNGGALNLSGGTVSGDVTLVGGSALNFSGGTISGNLNLTNGDMVNWSGGNVRGSVGVPAGTLFNWSGGTANGPLNITTNAVLNLVGAGSVALWAPLTNAGAINWSNSVTVYVYNNNSSGNNGAIWNLPAGLLNIQSDQGLNGEYCCAFVNNAGTISKGANTGTTSFNLNFTNSGLVTVSKGAINFNSGGDIEAAFTAGAGAAINFNGGNFVYSTSPALTGPGAIQFTGGNLAMLNSLVPNLALIGGTITVGNNFQGGTITNLTSGANLNGSFTVSGVFNCNGSVSGNLLVTNGGTLNLSGGTISGNLTLTNGATANWNGGNVAGNLQVPAGALVNWSGGTANGPVNIASNGILNLLGGGSIALWAPLTNAGTINWSNSVTFYVYNNNSSGNQGQIWNLAGALFNIQSDQGLNGEYCCAFFNNAGTISKGAYTGTTSFNLALTNSGPLDVESGTIAINGNFAQTAGAWTFGLNGPGNYGQVHFPGIAPLGGPLNAHLNGGYIPADNSSFALVTYNSETGQFTATNLPAQGLFWQFQYGPNAASLLVTNYYAPFVAVTNPLNGAAFIAPANISLGALATDTNASIAKVEFFQGLTKIGQVTTIPYSLAWNNVAPGFYSVAAKATDAVGATATSSPININVYSAVNPSTNFFWTGGVSSDWFTPGNWTPAGVPGALDVVNITNGGTVTLSSSAAIASLFLSAGTLNGSGSLTVTNLFNWTGGTVACPMALSSNAVLNLSGSGPFYLANSLTNHGTVNWTGGGLYLNNCSGTAAIFNMAGATWNILCDQFLNPSCGGGNAYFQNSGVLRKSTTTGATSFSVPIYSTGQVAALTGSINFNSGGTIDGAFNASNGAAINFSGGNFTTVVPVVAGPGLIQFNGGTLTLSNDIVANLALTGGNIALGPNFQGGTITNFTVAGSTLTGTNTVSGTLNWSAGTINGPLTIAHNGVLNLQGNGTMYMANVLTNSGTVNWSNGVFTVVNCSGPAIPLVNLAGGFWNIYCDQTMTPYCGTITVLFQNAGTLQKSGSFGTTYISIPTDNTGQITALTGTLNFNNGATLSGAFNVAAGAAINFSGGNFTGGSAILSGSGLIQFSGGTLTLPSDIIPNLALNNGTLTLGPGFQGGAITNLTLGGGTLTGSNTVTGTFNWNGGTVGGPLFVAPTGVLNLGGNSTMYLTAALTNSGTVNWLGGVLDIYSCSVEAGPIVNLAGAAWNILSDQTLNQSCSSTNGYFQNSGTVQKSATAGTTSISIPFYDAGTLALMSGTVAFSGNPAYAPTGATMDFGVTNLSSAGHVAIAGNLNFDGTLTVNALNGYVPATGDILSLISYAAEAGAFGSVNFPQLEAGQAWQLSYTPSTLLLQVVSSAGFNQQITGSVTDNQGHAVPNLTVFAYTTNGVGSYISGATDANGNYLLNVTNGTWLVNLVGLPGHGYNSVANQVALINNANTIINFVLQPFTGQSFTIATSVNPPTAGTATGGGVFLQGSTVTVTATETNGTIPYLFESWTENGVFESANNSYSFPSTRDRALVANFTLPLYTVSVTNVPPGAGTVTGGGSFYYGTTNVLTAYPVFGYKFSSWTEGANTVGLNPTLVTVVYSNHFFTANYAAANLVHVVATATAPSGLAPVAGAGSYNNGQTANFSAPLSVTNPPFIYTFQQFTLSNTLASPNASFSKTFSTLDPTNLFYVAVYSAKTILPVLSRVSSNFGSPVPATTNFVLSLQFDRTMTTNVSPVIVLTNSAAAVQAAISSNGNWASTFLQNDTYVTPPITISPGMDGTMQLLVSGASDLNGNILALTNPVSFLIQATPPPNPIPFLAASNSSSATVSWAGYSASPNLAGFRVFLERTNFNSAAGLPAVTGLGAGARIFQIFGLSLDTPYYVALQAFDNVGNSLPAVTPLPILLTSSIPPPVSIQQTPVGGSSALVSWNNYNSSALLGLSGFWIYSEPANYTSVAGLTPVGTVGPAQTSFQINGLDRTKTNHFAVVGFNDTNGFNPSVATVSWSDPYAGQISANTTIGGAGQTVVPIYQSVVVANNATLTIQPGTSLLFSPGTGLTIEQGTLVANGTALAPIVFDSANDSPGNSPAPGDWSGVTLTSGAGGSSLNFVTILYGGGLLIDRCSPSVLAFTAQHNLQGLALQNGASLNTSSALLSLNGIGAEQADTATLSIENSVLQDNNTNLWNSGSAALTAISNWWGTATQSSITALLQGNVTYTPFLTYAPLLTPALGVVGGLTQVGTSSVNLQLACRTATSMRLSEDYTFNGVFFGPFTNSATFPLSAGGGLKHIFAQFRSVTGQTNTPVEVDVTYITAGPVINSFSLTEGETLNRPVTVTGSATAILGMQDMEFYWDGVGLATNSGGSFSYSFDIRSQNNGTHQAVLLARDTAGNAATLEENVVVALTPPLAPQILSPSTDYVTNNGVLNVSGTAEPDMSIQLTDNGQLLLTTNTDANGNFAVPNVILTEGVNTLVAVAFDNTGTTPSAPRHITAETIPPAAVTMAAPIYTPGAGLTLTWTLPASGKQPTAFQLFWNTTPFNSLGQALAHAGPLGVLTDNLQGLAAGTYYFGVVGYDAAGNASPLSSLVSINYDPVPPSLSIVYGSSQPVGVGPLNITLGSSKALAAKPSLTIQPAGSTSPILLSLTNVALNTWQTVFPVTSSTPSGTAAVQATAQDTSGNLFQGSPAGQNLVIDTTPPTGTVATAPAGPVQTINNTNLAVNLILSKPAGSGTTPTLSFHPPVGANVPISLSGAGNNWNGTITLTPAMGSGFGAFALSAQDSLGNVGTSITSGGQLEIYNTALPSPPVAPVGLTATSLAGGYVSLTWNTVSNAQIYRLYREAGPNFVIPATLDIDNITSNNVLDLPPTDGLYSYGVSASRLDSESGISNVVHALSARTPPLAPTNVIVTLAATGVQVSWQEPGGGLTPDHYSIYRNGTLIQTVSSVVPIIDYPPRGTDTYVVSAVDAVGNASPSSPVSLQLLVSPVNNLSVTVMAGEAPLLNWVSTDNTVVGFNVYRNGVKQNASPLTGTTSYLDNLALSDATAYGVSAVNGSGQESPQRVVTVYPFAMGLAANGSNPVLIHYFDQIQIAVTNLSSTAALPMSQLVLSRAGSGQASLSVTQAVTGSLAAGANMQQTLVLPESPVVGNQVMTVQLFQKTDSEGNSASYQESFVLANSERPGIEMTVAANQVPLAGGLNTFQVQVFNHGYADMQLIVSRGFNAHPGDLYISVQNNVGQEVSRTAFQGAPPGTVFLNDGTGYLDIPPGSSLTFSVPNVLVPAALDGATNVAFVAVATAIYNQLGAAGQMASGPLSGAMISPSLALPPYYGTAQTDHPAYANDQPVVITGQAISQTNGLPLPSAMLNIGFATRGYKWYQSVTTDTNGNYSFTFFPPPGFGGSLSIWACHPLVLDQLNQAQITIYRLYVTPNAEDIQMSKNGTLNFSVRLINPGDTALTALSTTLSAYQVAGTNLTPITSITGTNLGGPALSIAAGQSQNVELQLAASINAPDTAQVDFTFTSAEGASVTLTGTVDLFPAVPVVTVVSPASGYLEVSLNRGNQVSGQITFMNSGLDTLRGLTLVPPTNVTWMAVNAPLGSDGLVHLPDLPVGQSNTFSVVFNPPDTTPLTIYQDAVVLHGSNLSIPYTINVYAVVTSDQTGGVQFEVDDILGQQVSGASIRLHNDALRMDAGPVLTDTNGFVTVTNLQGGSWNWEATAPGCSANVGTVNVIPDQVVYQHTRLSRSLVTVSFSVVPVPFSDQYQLQVQQTFETYVPAGVLVLDPAAENFNNVTPGFQASFLVNAKNYGLVQMTDVQIKGSQSGAASFTPLITYIPVLLPQQTVSVPMVFSFGVTNSSTGPGPAKLDGGGAAGCVASAFMGAFGFSDLMNPDVMGGLAAIFSAQERCVKDLDPQTAAATVAALYGVLQLANDFGDAASALGSAVAQAVGCIIGNLLGGLAGGGGGGGGGPSSGDTIVGQPVGCFPADTLVRMADGTQRAISTLATNDLVQSGVQAGDVSKVNQVLEFNTHKIQNIQVIDTAGGVVRSLFATAEHLFWVDGKGWLPAAELGIGDYVLDWQEHRLRVVRNQVVERSLKVYTLGLTGDTAFYANGILVHDLCQQSPSSLAGKAAGNSRTTEAVPAQLHLTRQKAQ
ncbi:MAG TPA: Ig-like domain-containing protein [Verrucomicrobiae bacterium]|nr:Ig-like domain-containing protein [Verrucomicrobiae bacterium]